MALTVLEVGENVAAGYAGKLFRRWGADVVRVDDPSAHDGNRRAEHVAVDLYLHAGKTRTAIDYRAAAGRKLLNRLAAKTDIVLTDLDVADLDAIEWTTLGGAAPKVRGAITPFGIDGPKRHWQAACNVLLAMGGQTYLMGDDGRAPLTMPGRYLQYQSGQYAYTAMLACFRARGDEAARIDVSMLEVALSLSQFTTVMWTYGGQIRRRHGNDFGSLHPITMYPCADGWFAVNVTPDFWPNFTAMLGRPEIADDPKFVTPALRVDNAVALDAIVHESLGGKTRADLLELGQRVCRVPTGILATPSELMNDAHLLERGFWQTLEHDGRALTVPGSAFRYVGEPQPPQPDPAPPVDAAALLER